ncbi:MAG: glycosyltransferase family 4 protein [Flavobacterium sp.]|nr:glycosyltransferase family 4 protein [Flavobacterium sp.]
MEIPIKKPSEVLVYGYLGRFSKEKGILELLDFFSSINSKLFLAGNGPLENEVADLIKSKPTIVNLGVFQTSEMATFFNQIDVLIIPSFEEAGPLVAIEAMAAGKIILATKVGALEERLAETQNQFWFDINNKKSFEESISKIETLDTETFYQIQKQLRKRYLENYSNEKIKNDYKKLLP